MPPKRKGLAADVDEKLRKAKVMKKSEPKSRIEAEYSDELESEYKDTIKYDEYMSGGIPSSLLEGLGFTESGSTAETNMAAEDGGDDVDGAQLDAFLSMAGCLSASSLSDPEGLSPLARSSYYGVDQIHALAKSGILAQQMVDLTSSAQMSTGFPSESVISTTAPMRSSQRLSAKSSSPSAETTTGISSNGAPGKTSIAATPPGLRPEAAAKTISASRTARFCDSASNTVTKGNIVYRRMPTGEVIASLVRNPQTDDSARLLHQGTAVTGSGGRALPLPPSFQGAQSTGFAAFRSGDCPINEYNVGEVLERSIKAMQSMRMLLTSLRDDLRRIGAGNEATAVTDEQARKRQEVADKLTKAYVSYKRSIEDIESQPSLENLPSAGGQTAAAATADVIARPVVRAKNDAAIRSNVKTRPRMNFDSGAKLDRGKSQSDDCEVIELSGSDEECTIREVRRP